MTARRPVVDAHHHLWDPPRTANLWLTGPHIAFRYGDYGAIAKPFRPAEFRAAAAAQNVVASVTMEGEWDPADPVAETRYIARLAADEDMPQAHVARAFLDAPDVEAVLAAHATHPIVRSIRHKPAATSTPAGEPGGLSDPAFQRGFALLARHGLHFDLQTPWWHLSEAAALGERHPDTLIVLNHTGLPADRTAEALAAWHTALAHFATLPSARVKLSGLGLPGGRWPVDENVRLARQTLELFGPRRTMVASNFPVDSLCADYDTVMDTFRTAVADLSEADQHQVLVGTAAATYGLVVP